MKGDFKLVGLSRPKMATLEHLGNDDRFHAEIDMPQGRIDALWLLCKNNWDDGKIAEVEFDFLSAAGIPMNAKVIGIRFKN